MSRIKKRMSERGVVSVEASIVLTLFIFMMLFLYSFLTVFAAQSVMAHTLTASCQSMSLDPYATSNLGLTEDEFLGESVGEYLYELIDVIFGISSGNEMYMSGGDWFEWEYTQDADGNYTAVKGEDQITDTPLTDIIEDRFLGYLGGDEAEAEKLFDVLNIANGLDGLDFSASRIEGGDLCINVTYVIEYQFGFNNFFGIDLGITEKEVTQEVRSKLWGV